MVHLIRFRIYYALFLTLFFITACKKENNTSQNENDSVLVKYVQNNIDTTVDYYFTSTYKPDNPLYQPVLAIQRERWDIAVPLLEKLVKENNPDAMYWLATISGGSIFSGDLKAKLFEKSAELGNPYAALRLNEGSDDCETYLKGICSREWGKKAEELFENRASEGDLKSKYFLQKLEGKKVNNLLEIGIENAKHGYFYPLYEYVFYTRNLNLDLKKNLYRIMVKNHFTPVANLMYLNYRIDNLNNEFYIDMLDDLEMFDGVWNAKVSFYESFIEKKPTVDYIKNYIESSFILELIKKGNYSSLDSSIDKTNVDISYGNSILSENGLSLLDGSNINKIKNDAVNKINNLKPIIFIDEFYYSMDKL